jgi:putative FmdB family regulatory protein
MIYDFLCQKCKKTFIVFEKKPPKVPPICPHCVSNQTKRIYNPPNVIFKGPGFYTTDNKKRE